MPKTFVLDRPAQEYVFVRGHGGRRKRMGAKQIRKLLMLRERLIKEIQSFADEHNMFFNHAIDTLATIGLQCVDASKRRKGTTE